ncbi:MAG TPA: division/cell wall cluster transcriptional repressor MraZ [Clostridia bacterium]|nr:division/cell wall cluster transcriptional repressor MraZ [Clostridia bacterium]
MFMGEYQHTVDEKGRVIIPAKFREELGEKFIITKGLDNCLFVYPQEEWSNLEQKLKQLPFTKADARAFVRFFFSGATEASLDKQGRTVLPNNLREYAKIDKDVVIIGVSTRVEIWNKEKWQSYSSEAEIAYESIAENIHELGF